MSQIFTSTNSGVEQSELNTKVSKIIKKRKEIAMKRMTLTTLGLATLASTLLFSAGSSEATYVRTAYINVPAEAFHDPAQQQDCKWNVGKGEGHFENGGFNNCRVVAPVYIPTGGKIKTMWCGFTMTGNTYGIDVDLKRSRQNQEGEVIIDMPSSFGGDRDFWRQGNPPNGYYQGQWYDAFYLEANLGKRLYFTGGHGGPSDAKLYKCVLQVQQPG